MTVSDNVWGGRSRDEQRQISVWTGSVCCAVVLRTGKSANKHQGIGRPVVHRRDLQPEWYNTNELRAPRPLAKVTKTPKSAGIQEGRAGFRSGRRAVAKALGGGGSPQPPYRHVRPTINKNWSTGLKNRRAWEKVTTPCLKTVMTTVEKMPVPGGNMGNETSVAVIRCK